ncbi:unnamed protein product [Adineta ricciae]|uniref:Ubiquitin carboxyl-terminal hydrolase n=1 Tax=Adineta ricciae TaxID=249248 RepID=A0A814ARQ9_ADIRI|nr:unnamed protein product [Adineta ricciae]
MSNPEPSTAAVVDDLGNSLTENVVITPSSNEEVESASQPVQPNEDKTPSTSDNESPPIATVATATATAIPQTNSNESKEKDFHLIKWIEFNFERLPILLQNLNGPCPLLAIFNILLLRKRIVIKPNMDAITTERVITLLAEHILEHKQPNLSEEDQINYEHNVQDALVVLDKLKTGLDVNLKFDGVDKFEYTPECIIFDLLNIQLFHGWVIDPQDTELRTIVNSDAPSYNQLVEKMIRERTSEREELVRESLLIEQFLDENRSQLTHYGILQLNQTMRDNQLAVFFRNNHFSTIWKNQNQLLVLVSDQGYLDHRSIVFETLTDVDNDSLFTDGYGRIWRKPEPVDSSRDRDLALALHNEEERLYHQTQQQQQQQQQSHGNSAQLPRSPSKQPKKSKNKQRGSPNDDDDKGSCTIS